jgi:hypothetical protein
MSTHCCVGYLKVTYVRNVYHQPNGLLAWMCDSMAYFSHCCWMNSTAGNFIFVPQMLQCSWFSGTQCSLKHHTYTSLMMLSQEIRMDLPHFLFTLSIFQGVHFLHHKMWWALVLQTPLSREYCPTDIVRERVKACNTVSALPLSVELRSF